MAHDDPRRKELINDTAKYLEASKTEENILKLWMSMSDEDKKKYRQGTFHDMLLKHRPTSGALGLDPFTILIIGVVIILVVGVPATVYAIKYGDAQKIMGEKWGKLGTPILGLDFAGIAWPIALVVGAVKILPGILARKKESK